MNKGVAYAVSRRDSSAQMRGAPGSDGSEGSAEIVDVWSTSSRCPRGDCNFFPFADARNAGAAHSSDAVGGGIVGEYVVHGVL